MTPEINYRQSKIAICSQWLHSCAKWSSPPENLSSGRSLVEHFLSPAIYPHGFWQRANSSSLSSHLSLVAYNSLNRGGTLKMNSRQWQSVNQSHCVSMVLLLSRSSSLQNLWLIYNDLRQSTWLHDSSGGLSNIGILSLSFLQLILSGGCEQKINRSSVGTFTQLHSHDHTSLNFVRNLVFIFHLISEANYPDYTIHCLQFYPV